MHPTVVTAAWAFEHLSAYPNTTGFDVIKTWVKVVFAATLSTFGVHRCSLQLSGFAVRSRLTAHSRLSRTAALRALLPLFFVRPPLRSGLNFKGLPAGRVGRPWP